MATSRTPDSKDDTGEKLGRIRNEFFHYPDLRRKTAERGKLPVMKALVEGPTRRGRSRSARKLSAASGRTLPTSSALSSWWHISASTKTDKELLNRVYPHGVGRYGARDHTSGTPVTNFRRSNRLYRQNKGLDRDKDGIACEKK